MHANYICEHIMIVAEHSVETTAKPEQIWQLYKDHTSWPQWDPDLEYVELKGVFQKGAKGIIKPKGGPKVKFIITECIPNKRMTDLTYFPLAKCIFSHEILPIGKKCKVTHRVEMTSLMAPIFAITLGRKIKKTLPLAMSNLVEMAEIQ